MAPLASGTRVALAYIEEVTRGVTPAAPNLTYLRTTSRAIDLEKNILESAEVRSSRQKRDVRHGFNSVAGAPGYELSRLAYDDFLSYALSNNWYNIILGATIDIAVSGAGVGGSATITRGSGDWIADGVRVGDVLRFSSFVNSGNDGDKIVVDVTDSLNIEIEDSQLTAVDETANASAVVVYPGSRLDVGTLLRTVTMERQFLDIGQFQVSRGVAVNQMDVSIQPENIIGGTFNLIGMSAAPMAQVSIEDTATNAAPTEAPFAAFDGVLLEGATAAVISVVTGIDFSLANNRSLEAVVGSKFSPDVFEGQAVITGTLTAFFETETLFNKFVDETLSRIIMKMDDVGSPGDFMTFVFPSVKYTGGSMDPPPEGPVPLEMPFQALESDEVSVGSTTVQTSMFMQRSADA